MYNSGDFWEIQFSSIPAATASVHTSSGCRARGMKSGKLKSGFSPLLGMAKYRAQDGRTDQFPTNHHVRPKGHRPTLFT
jgi:hypothetical protein